MIIASPRDDSRRQLFIFLILLASYLLIYIPTPDSADGDAILAVSAALIRTGSVDISVIGAQDALFEHDMSRMGVFGADGALYSKKGIAPSLALLPFSAAAQLAPWLSLRAAAMIFNPLVTALTGALLFTLVRTLGFGMRNAAVVALLYGWATTAAVYTKTLFGEPLAGLLVVIAVLAIVRFWERRHYCWLLAAGASVGFAIGINLTYIVTAGVVGAFALVPLLNRQRRPRHVADIAHGALIFALPIIIALTGIALYNAARFGSPFTSGYYLQSGEGFNRPFVTGLFGLTLSPYRGLLWYSPIVLLAFPGIWMLWRRQKRVAAFLAAIVLSQYAVYASWWSWHGGVVWGPRFILPVLPLIMLSIAPIIERASHLRALRWSVAGLAALSFSIQILGVLLSPYPFYGVLSGRYGTGDMNAVVATLRDDVLYDPAANAAIGHLNLLIEGTALDPSWLRGSPILFVCALVLGGTAYWVLRSNWRYTPHIALLAGIAVLNVVVASQNASPSHLAAQRLNDALADPAPILVASSDYGSALLDIESHRVLSVAAPTAPDDHLAAPMWRHARTLDTRLWYVTWFPPAAPDNWVEEALWQDEAFAAELTIEAHRALLFERAEVTLTITGGWRFGDVQLTRYGIAQNTHSIQVALEWNAAQEITENLTWFVHLLNAQGEIVLQQDRPPLGGYLLSGTWSPGERVTDRLAFDTARDAVAMRIGWVNPTLGERLPVRAPDGSLLPDSFVVIPMPN